MSHRDMDVPFDEPKDYRKLDRKPPPPHGAGVPQLRGSLRFTVKAADQGLCKKPTT